VCSSAPHLPKVFDSEKKRFEGWSEKTDEITDEEVKNYTTKLVGVAT
jgi:hypothetical protein